MLYKRVTDITNHIQSISKYDRQSKHPNGRIEEKVEGSLPKGRAKIQKCEIRIRTLENQSRGPERKNE